MTVRWFLLIRKTSDAGSSKIEPGLTPENNITAFYTLDQFKEKRGKNCLDGGMHFTTTVEDSYKLCKGFEEDVEKRILELLNGSDDMLTVYTPGGGSSFFSNPIAIIARVTVIISR